MKKTLCPNCGTYNADNAKYCLGCGRELPQPEFQSPDKSSQQKNSKDKKGNSTISILAFTITFAIAFFVVQYFFFDDPSIEKTMMEVAAEINTSCPMMIDRDTRLDNTVALTNHVFQYNYTLVRVEKAKLDVDVFRANLEPGIVQAVKTSPDMKFFRDHKMTINYHYRDKNGVFVLKIGIPPEQYN